MWTIRRRIRRCSIPTSSETTFGRRTSSSVGAMAWLDREVVKKHRTNWLGKNPEYIEVTDPAVIKKYWPWMPDEEIKERLEAERQRKFLKVMRDEMPFDKWKQMMTANPPSMAKELELKFEN